MARVLTHANTQETATVMTLGMEGHALRVPTAR